MLISERDLLDTATAYLARHPDQAAHLKPLTERLDAGLGISAQSDADGHFTASAVVEREGRILVVKHRKSGSWIQPGGHIEDTDRTLYGAALRELAEETGLRDVRQIGVEPIHIAVHRIPASPDTGAPEHVHFDVRYGFTTHTEHVWHGGSENDGVVWVAPHDIADTSLLDAVGQLQREMAREPTPADLAADEQHRGRGIPMGVYLILRDDAGRLLVGLRSDRVGICPDMWALPCGSREFGESAPSAMAREAFEELGITIAEQDLRCVHIADVHNAYGPTTAVYFTADRWAGTIANREPDLCRELRWVEPSAPLPTPFVEHVQAVLDKRAAGSADWFTTVGWAPEHAQAAGR